jgi:hypothetical protein
MLGDLSITTLVNGLFNRSEPSPMNREQFSRWPTGFIDGEGNFQVYLDRYYLPLPYVVRTTHKWSDRGE